MLKRNIGKFLLMSFVTFFVSNLIASEIIFQGFHWESYRSRFYRDLNTKVREIKNAGFTSVWLPPVSKAYDGEGRYAHSRGYMPIEIFNFNSSYGSELELKRLVQNFNRANIKVIADLVLNHRMPTRYQHGHFGDNRYAIFTNPDWALWGFTSGPGQVGHGAPDTGVNYQFAFDVDITNQQVRKDTLKYVQKLKRIGFKGWRYDFVKGYSPELVALINKATRPAISIGELWTDMRYCGTNRLCYNQDAHRKKIIHWIDSTWKHHNLTPNKASAAFDFTTKGILQQAIKTRDYRRLKDSRGRAAGLIGLWPGKSVTFVDNHDTGSTQNLWPFGSKEQIIKGYVYILTHPGTPTVFYDHFYYWKIKDFIKRTMQIRHDYDLKASSVLKIQKAESNLYAAIIDNKVAMKLGSKAWAPSGNWKLLLSGNNWAIWGK